MGNRVFTLPCTKMNSFKDTTISRLIMYIKGTADCDWVFKDHSNLFWLINEDFEYFVVLTGLEGHFKSISVFLNLDTGVLE
jgi:hypothetical protein